MESYDPLYLSGIARFNRGEYFQSHEIWEELWKATDGPSRLFYKGMIQVAVALHHAGAGNRRGACRLFHRSCHALEAYRPRYLGLDVERFLVETGRCLRAWATPEGLSHYRAPQIGLSPLENDLSVPPVQPILEHQPLLRPESGS